MPVTKTVKVYQFDELSDEAKEKARGWYREGGFDYEWWDGVEDDFKTIANTIGITDVKIYFSGFSSQGDGACFEGSYHYEKGSVKKLMEYAPKDTELHRIVKGLYEVQRQNFYGISGRVKHSGHYYHKYCTDIELYKDYTDGGNDYLKDNDIVKELLRDLMAWLYRTLRDEYDYLNSDEQVDETIKCNEYEFTEDGKRYKY
jgi:hypothetical protein